MDGVTPAPGNRHAPSSFLRVVTCARAVSPAKLAALSGPDVPPTREEVRRIIARMQKKDIYGIFREPVTDEMVRRPLPFFTGCKRRTLQPLPAHALRGP